MSMPPMEVTFFQEAWLQNPKFSTWIQQTAIQTEAKCKLCCKTIDLSNMGTRALESHAQSAKHVKLNNESGAIKMFFSPKSADHNKNDVKGQNDFHVSNGVTDAEIRWVLNIVKKHVSYRSCVDDLDVFPTMFPDSQIAQQTTLGKTKFMYLCV